MDPNRWWNYVKQTMGDDTALEAGRKAMFDSSAFTRWKQGRPADVHYVVKFARGYNKNVLEALAAAGFITDKEASLHEVKTGVEDLDTVALAEELLRRVSR